MEIQHSNQTLDEMLNDSNNNKEVYVINTSKARSTALINFVVPGSRSVDTHLIHSTWIPQRIFPDKPKNVLLDSLDLRRYITLGLISLVDLEWAKKVLETSEAKHEENRLNLSQHSIFSGELGQKLKSTATEENKKVEITDDFKNSIQDMKQEVDEEVVFEVNDRVKDLVARFDTSDIELRSFISELKNLSPILNERDYSWLIQNSSSSKVKDYAKNQLGATQDQKAVV